MINKRLTGVNFVIVSLIFLIGLSIFITGHSDNPQKEYGVFLGINAEHTERLNDYHMVVIEPAEFQAKQVHQLHKEGKLVYGYINIGAIEAYRPYYERFEHCTLDVYENWEDEHWMDVSCPEWQAFVINELGKQYADMGLDGFFLDNADVYYHYPTEGIFEGLCSILSGLKAYKIPLIINGGDFFVARCIDEDTARYLFDGINQETVFTSIDFENGSYGTQKEGEMLYFENYIAKVKNYGLTVYLLEYRADQALTKKIDNYCRENGFHWYNAESLELK